MTNERFENVKGLLISQSDVLDTFKCALYEAYENFKASVTDSEYPKGYEDEALSVASSAINDAKAAFERDLQMMTARDINMLYQPPTYSPTSPAEIPDHIQVPLKKN